MSKALVTFARNRIGYTVTKSLAEKGIQVIAADSIKYAMTFFSKYKYKKFIYPDPHKDEEGFIKSILNFCKKEKVKTIITGHEEGFILSKHLDLFKRNGIHIPLSSYDTIQQAHDKNKINKRVERLGLLIPKTYRVSKISELPQVADKINYFPTIIKLIKSRGGIGFAKIYSKDELIKKYTEIVEEFGIKNPDDFPIIQEYIEGYGLGVSMLFDRGKAVASFSHKRVWEMPPEGGFSIERISVHHKEAETAAKKILEDLNWHGVAMVEFRVDSKTEKPYFLEINPRFWGSLNQAVRAGVDFPYLAYQVARKEDYMTVFDYKVGVRTRWLAGMLTAIPMYIKTKLFGKYLISLLKFIQKDMYYDDFALTDPLPFGVQFISPFIDLIKTGSVRQKELDEVKNEYK